jgi:hypothetical protein
MVVGLLSAWRVADSAGYEHLTTSEIPPAMKTFLHRRPMIGREHYQSSHSEADNAVSPIGKPRAFPAISSGAAAIGAFAIGRLVIGRLSIKKARIGKLEVGELKVGRLEVAEIAGRGAASKESESEAKL